MSILETTLIFVGIPLLIILVFAGVSYFEPRSAGPLPSDNEYVLGQKWEHAPLLWSATDESTHPGHHAHHGHAAGDPVELIGGTASGKW